MEINLDFEKESMDILKLKQQDDRTLIANIFSDSVPFDLAGSTVKVNASNYLGQAIIQTENIAISGNKVTINLIRDITRVSGMTKLELAITKSNKQLTTFTFYLDVKQSVLEGANLEVSIVADIIEVLTTKIDEAVKCKAETEQLIATGNAATKGDVAEINSHLDSIAVNVEYFRFLVEGDNWTKAIRKAIEKAGVGGTIQLNRNTVYTINGQLNMLLKQRVLGYGATLKRANESKATLSVSATNTDRNITVDTVPSDWEIGDTIHLFTGNKGIETTYVKTITGISGNTITLNGTIGNLVNSSTSNSYPVGTGVRKVYIMLAGQQYPIPFNNIVEGLTFDGNKDNNSSNYFWNHNNTLHIYGREAKVSNCKFINIPNENIVTHGSKIDDNYAENLNGSFVHLSSPPSELGEDIMGCNITNNFVKYSNMIANTIGLHSNCVIEQSWNAGRVIVESNYFEGVGNDYCLDIIEPTDENNNKKYYNDIKYVGNTFKNYKGIARNVDNYIAWDISEKIIAENIFNSCGYNDFSNLPSKNIIFINNLLTSGTGMKGVKNILKGDLVLDNGFSVKNANGSIFGVYNTDDNYLTLQRGSTQYLTISPTDNIQFNEETKIKNSFDGEIRINNFQRFVTNSSSTVLGTSQLNTTYPHPAFAIGSEVYFPNISTPSIAKKVSSSTWRWITTTS